MLGQLKGFVSMPSSLALFLRSEIDRRGWDDSKLARKAGIHKSALHYILTKDTAGPYLKTLDKLARALDVPLARLIRVAGYDPGEDDRPVEIEQTAILMETVPELREVVDSLKTFSAEDLRAIRLYVQGRRDQARDE